MYPLMSRTAGLLPLSIKAWLGDGTTRMEGYGQLGLELSPGSARLGSAPRLGSLVDQLDQPHQ